jgi:hypothetical protein
MESSTRVRFNLFGKFRASRNGLELEFPDRDFFTYLKLLLLSGKSHLAHSRECPIRKSKTSKQISDVLNKGNNPLVAGGLGQYGFVDQTGIALRFREGAGLVLVPENFTCDVREFEEIWGRLETCPRSDLEQALEIYGDEIDLSEWKKDGILIDCLQWVENRIQQLERYRDELRSELDRRDQKASAENGNPTLAKGEEAAGSGKDEGDSRLETSGFESRADRFSSSGIDSASLGGALRPDLGEPGAVDDASDSLPNAEQVDSVLPDDKSDDDSDVSGSAINDLPVLQVSADSDEVSSSQLSKEERSEDARFASDDPIVADPSPSRDHPTQLTKQEGRRTVTALGIIVVVLLVATIFLLGFFLAKLNTPKQETASNPSRGSDSKSGSGTSAPGGDIPVVRAPENPVYLRTLYVESLTAAPPESSTGDIIIGRQLLTDFIYTGSGTGNESVGVYRLDGQFRTLKCIIGVPDADAHRFGRDAEWIRFEADGRELDRIRVKTGSPTPVTIPVRNVKVLIVTQRDPAVIASARVWR